jgi:hypothetical protein
VAEIMADIAVQSQAGKQSADDTNLEEQIIGTAWKMATIYDRKLH